MLMKMKQKKKITRDEKLTTLYISDIFGLLLQLLLV